MKRLPPKKVAGKVPVKRTPARKKAADKKMSLGKIFRYSFLLFFVTLLMAMGYNYRHGVLYWLGFKTDKRIESLTKEERKIANLRMFEIFSRHKDKVFGFDVSHYQGKIQWDSLQQNNIEFPMQFVFIRSTAGKNLIDKEFKSNWKEAGKKGLIRGAYHYYRPDENSLKQADNFIKTVKLQKGDLPPVLDIERMPKKQSMDSLKAGIKRWLDTTEKHYGVKPILYSGESFYSDFLQKEFLGYTVWIANYNFFVDEIKDEWHFWQFTDKGALKGIPGSVDINIYNGNREAINNLCIQ